MSREHNPLARFWQPRYWPVWVGIGLLRLICLLPHKITLAIGRGLGRLGYALGGTRRAIVRRNIELCFPELDAEGRDEVAKKHYESVGIGVIEIGLARWGSDRFHDRIGRIEGFEHLDAISSKGQGVILLSGHFSTLEMMGRKLGMISAPIHAVYRKNRSEFITELQRTGREMGGADATIEKRDTKGMVRSLRNGHLLWYAPDQSYDRAGAAVIDFLGVPAMCTTATSKLARLGKAAVLPYFSERQDDGTYVFRILPPFENFPSDDPIEDTKQYVQMLEEQVRRRPEQYLWAHRKFKNLPPEYPDYYADLDALK